VTELNPFPDGILEPIKKLFFEESARAKKLKAQAEEAEHITHIWKDLITFINKDWPLHIVDILDRETPLFKKLLEANNPAIISLEEIYRMSKEKAEVQRRRFPVLFEKACKEIGLPIDHDSQHPKYTFFNYFFKLEIDERRGMASLGNYEGRLKDLPADISAIIEVIEIERKRIFERTYDGTRFLKKIYTQYSAVLKNEKLPDGSSIPIRHITRRLGKNEKGFRTDEFLIDLTRLVERGPKEIEGNIIDLQQTKDTNQGMLLHGKAGQGYIGFITFRRLQP
jgi:hypothetical protein